MEKAVYWIFTGFYLSLCINSMFKASEYVHEDLLTFLVYMLITLVFLRIVQLRIMNGVEKDEKRDTYMDE